MGERLAVVVKTPEPRIPPLDAVAFLLIRTASHGRGGRLQPPLPGGPELSFNANDAGDFCVGDEDFRASLEERRGKNKTTNTGNLI